MMKILGLILFTDMKQTLLDSSEYAAFHQRAEVLKQSSSFEYLASEYTRAKSTQSPIYRLVDRLVFTQTLSSEGTGGDGSFIRRIREDLW